MPQTPFFPGTTHATQPFRVMLASAATLARWQLRNVWRLLLFLTLGVVASVILACLIPLYFYVTTSTQLRSIFTAPPGYSSLTITGSSTQLTRASINQISLQINQLMQQNLGPYLSQQQQQRLFSPTMHFATPESDRAATAAQDILQIDAFSKQSALPHITLLSGHLPQSDSIPQILLTQEAASYLKIAVGSTLSLKVVYNTNADGETQTGVLQLRVAGLFKQNSTGDPFWQSATFDNISFQKPESTMVVAFGFYQDIVSAIDHIDDGVELAQPFALSWSYQLDVLRLDTAAVVPLTTGLTYITQNIPLFITQKPALQDVTVASSLGQLQSFESHLAVTQLPIIILTTIVIGLLAFFVSLMIDLLVNQQTATIALLRSRGASHQQIFFALLTQFLCIGLLALLIGALLTLPIGSFLARQTLQKSQQGLFETLISNQLALLSQMQWQLTGIGSSLLITMIVTTYRATRLDMLLMRREAARSTRRPFWQRLYLDVAILVLAVIGYAALYYTIHSGLLDPVTRVLLEAPLFLLASVCLLLASALFFLRLFALLLRKAMQLAQRGRGLSPVLTLEQLARAPAQATRMILLLTFALSFIIFAQMFSLSQANHIQDVSDYVAGADMSGTLFNATDGTERSFDQALATYQHMAGVTAATLGNVSKGDLTLNDPNASTQVLDPSSAPSVKILSVDPASFLSATIWPDTATARALSMPFQQLIEQRASIVTQASTLENKLGGDSLQVSLPAIVDDAAWNSLHLSIGTRFSLYSSIGTMAYRVVGHVSHLPTVNDEVDAADLGEAGVLIDYKSELAVSRINGGAIVASANYAWLHVQNSPAALTHLRTVLSEGVYALSNLNDRYALMNSMQQDSLYLVFVNVLSLGALAPVLLALFGNLLASWMSARQRLLNFSVLRAMGTSIGQLVQLLSWEQGIIYGSALLLGLFFGILLSYLTLPSLTFTTLPTSSNVLSNTFALQNVPPIHILIPFSLLLILLVLIVSCIIGLVLMVRTSTKPLLGKTLRLNED